MSDFLKLETMIAHQEKLLQELNDVVIAQGTEIEALKKYISQQKNKLQELEHTVGQKDNLSPTEEAAANKPPHY